MSKFIIFQDGALQGYLNSEPEVKKALADLGELLVATLRKKNETEAHVFVENLSNGIKIYTQEIGRYLNGPVVCVHHAHWVPVQQYSLPRLE